MEPPIANNEDGSRDTRIAASIAALDNFIESQKISLSRLQDDVRRLEDLKNQAMLKPTSILRGILYESDEEYTRHSHACLELNTAIPELDWAVFDQPVQHTTPASYTVGSSRADRIRAQVAEFSQTVAALPALPAKLLDTDVRPTEDKAKKRKRADSTLPSTTGASLAYSGGLRLPYSNDLYTWATANTSQQRLHEPELRSTSISNGAEGLHEHPTAIATPLDATTQLYLDYAPPKKRTWASKGPTTFSHGAQLPSNSPPGSMMPDPEPEPVQDTQIDYEPRHTTQSEPTIEQSNEPEDLPATFKKNWSLEEQHTLERLLTEIPSTVKFRWVKISEAMGGTRTPRQVASRVQKYYEKMKKLGVAVDLADMGGGGRGGSKATQALDKPAPARSRSQSTRGTPKTGPQYTKSGRRR